MRNHWLHTHASALRARYARGLVRIQDLPLPGARPLTVAGRIAGWITAKATDSIAALPCVRVAHEAVHVGSADTPRARLNAVLAQIAENLRDGGCLRGWRDELLDVVAEGQTVAVIERSAMRPLGMLTRAVHLDAWTPDGRVWVAERAATKAVDPGLWDTLVGGLVAAGESLEDSLLRESAEEAGLAPGDLAARSPLTTMVRMHKRLPEGMQVEDMMVSQCVLPATTQPQNQDGEVSCIRALCLETLWDKMRQDAFTIEAEMVILYSLLGRIQHIKDAA